MNQYFSDALLSIFINISTESIKYLVFYDDEALSEENEDSLENSETNDNKRTSSTAINPKRAKLDYDAFTKNLKFA